MLSGMYVKTTRRRRGDKSYEYLSIVESVRTEGKVRHRTLLRLGEAGALRRSGELSRIVAALENHLERERVDLATVNIDGAPAIGGVAAVAETWQRVGLDEWFAKVGIERGAGALDGAVFAMIANRLIDPCAKRRLPEWVDADVVMPDGFAAPSTDQYYRALDAIADTKDATERWLYSALCDLTNLDLRLVCYDLTSSYLEGSTQPSDRFPSKAFGYSRDHRSDRPQIVLGLLTTGDGIPIAHHVFAGNTSDVSTLPGVLGDLQARFGVGRICVVADRGLISADNLDTVSGAGFDHIIATRLHHDNACAAALEAADEPTSEWVPVPESNRATCDVVDTDGTRYVVVASVDRQRRDTIRTRELVARTENKLLALEARVRDGRLTDAGKIGRAAQRILGPSGVSRLFDVEITHGHFLYHYNDKAFEFEQRLAGRYVLATSLTTTQASAPKIVHSYQQLAQIERRFRTLKDFLHLRPIRHWTERRVRGHIAACVYAAVIEGLIAQQLRDANIADPDIDTQPLTTPRAIRELQRIRQVTLDTQNNKITLITRRTPIQARILTALDIDTKTWDKAHIG